MISHSFAILTKETIYQAVGWLGAALVLVAFALTTLELLSPASVAAAVMNLVGGAGVAVISWHRRAYQPLVINLVWTIVASAGLFRVVF